MSNQLFKWKFGDYRQLPWHVLTYVVGAKFPCVYSLGDRATTFPHKIPSDYILTYQTKNSIVKPIIQTQQLYQEVRIYV